MENTVTAQVPNRSGLLRSEDWWAVWLGLFIVVLGAGPIFGLDLLGWASKFGVWIDPAKAVSTGSKGFAWLGSVGSLLATYVFTLVVTSVGAHFMGAKLKKFAAGYTVIFWITALSNLIGNYAYLAATPNKRAAFNIGWSLSLGELGFVIALLAGLVIGNFFPKVTRFLSDAATHAAELDADADAYFPLQPIEKKLCAYSLGLGLGLMACFVVLFEVL